MPFYKYISLPLLPAAPIHYLLTHRFCGRSAGKGLRKRETRTPGTAGPYSHSHTSLHTALESVTLQDRPQTQVRIRKVKNLTHPGLVFIVPIVESHTFDITLCFGFGCDTHIDKYISIHFGIQEQF